MKSPLPSLFVMLAVVLLTGSMTLPALAQDAKAETSPDSKWREITLPNPSFEDGDQKPDGWRALKGNTNNRSEASIMAWDNQVAHTGKRSLYIRRADGGPLRWSIADSVPIEAGTRYQLRAWFRFTPGEETNAGLSVSSRRRIESLGRLWEQSKVIESNENHDGQWQQGIFEFTPMEGVNEVWLRLSDHNRWPYRSGGPREIWVDDVSLWIAED